MAINTTVPDNTQQSEHNITANITTGNTELATTASNIEQTVPNEMDSIDPNITQNIGVVTDDMGEDADNEDNGDSDVDDIDDNTNERSGNVDSDEDFNDVVHESVGEDMPNDNLGHVQDSLDQIMKLQETGVGGTKMQDPSYSSFVQLVIENRAHHCPVSSR